MIKPGIVHSACSKPAQHGGHASELWTMSQLAKHFRQKAPGTGHLSLQGAAKATAHGIFKQRDLHAHKPAYYVEKPWMQAIANQVIQFLSITVAHYAPGWKPRIVLDNHSSHVSRATVVRSKKRPNQFEFVFTPGHGSWLNLVEVFFGRMARSFLRSLRVRSKDDLAERIYHCLDEINIAPVRFRWKYRLDEVVI